MQLKLSRGRGSRGLGLAYAVLIAGGFAVVRIWPGGLALLPACPWRALTGFPCPFCQGSHAFVALAYARVAEAWQLNPLVTGGVLVLLAWGILDLLGVLTGRDLVVRLSPRGRRWGLRLLGAILLANWVYLIFAAGI